MRNISVVLIIIFFSSCTSQSQDISQFRGPDRAGKYIEENLAGIWPESGPEVIFTIDSLGKGYGPPVIYDEQLFVTGTVDSTSVLFCFNLEGRKLWQTELGKEWVVNYPGSRSSPTIVNGLIYVGSGMGNLFCIDIKTKKIRWSKLLAEDFQGILPLFGHSESPYVFENKVFWTAGGKMHNVVALDRFTGEIMWTSKGFKERSAYHPPRVITLKNGTNILVTFSAYHLMGLDVEDGKLLWSQEQTSYPPLKRKPGRGDTHANTVYYEEGMLYYAEGDGNLGVKLKISEDGKNIKELWRNTSFDSYMGGIVKEGKYLYGSGTARANLYSIHSESGEIIDSLAIGRGSIVMADNKIYYYNQRGEVHLVNFQEGQLETVSHFRIKAGSQEHFSHPLIHKGIMYLRRGNAVIAYNIRG